MFSIVTTGILLGLSAGFAPGPLLTLVITETLRHDIRSGIKVALAPLITDLPIIIFTVFILSRLSHIDTIFGIISFLGGGLVFFLGYESIRTKGVAVDTTTVRNDSLLKGIAVNAISPHPYLFWFGVGAPIIIRAIDQSKGLAILFLCSFYMVLVGSKVLIAILVNRSRSFLEGKIYITIMRFLGLLLIGFSLFLFRDGLVFLGLV